MSNEELIGKLIVQYQEAGRELQARKSEANLYAQTLINMADWLEGKGTENLKRLGYSPKFDEYPTIEQIKTLLDHINQLKEKVQKTRDMLKQLGVDLA